jgi:signal transduction histidine kinase
MRALIFELHAESLAEEGLVAAFDEAGLCHRGASRSEDPHEAEPGTRRFRGQARKRQSIAQEALHKVVKHAEAHSAELTLEVDRTSVVLSVRAFGRGFDATCAFPGHFGLRSMQE